MAAPPFALSPPMCRWASCSVRQLRRRTWTTYWYVVPLHFSACVCPLIWFLAAPCLCTGRFAQVPTADQIQASGCKPRFKINAKWKSIDHPRLPFYSLLDSWIEMILLHMHAPPFHGTVRPLVLPPVSDGPAKGCHVLLDTGGDHSRCHGTTRTHVTSTAF